MTDASDPTDPAPDPDRFAAPGEAAGPMTSDDVAEALLGDGARADETADLGDRSVRAEPSTGAADMITDAPFTDGPVADGPDAAATGTAADGTAAPDDAAPEETPLARAERERAEYLDQLQRSRADYDNLNKRRHREVAEARDRGQAALVESLLEVLDNFGFALAVAEASDDTQLAKGVSLVHTQLLDALERSGLTVVPGVGAAFDPAHHEALMSEQDETEREQPEVAEVLRVGYRFKEQLLRPASVKVLE